jgi:energy-coupling factor transport system permease protein
MLVNFPYVKRDSPVHRLDPRTKIMILFVFIFTVTQSSNLWFVLAGLVVAVLYYCGAHLKWAETKSAWFLIISLAVVLIVMNYFITAGAVVQGVDLTRPHILYRLPFITFTARLPFVAFAPLVLSVESATFMLTQVLRNISIGLFVLPVAYTIDPADMGIAFRGMGVPDKIAYAIDLSLRFLPSIMRDFMTTYDAQRARGFEIEKLRGGVFGKIARMAPMIVPVVIGSIVDTEDIICAMELRCFGIGRRTWLNELHPRPLDGVIIVSSFAILIAITALDIAGAYVGSGPLHILHIQGIPHFLAP